MTYSKRKTSNYCRDLKSFSAHALCASKSAITIAAYRDDEQLFARRPDPRGLITKEPTLSAQTPKPAGAAYPGQLPPSTFNVCCVM